jgi:hypothetical protein
VSGVELSFCAILTTTHGGKGITVRPVHQAVVVQEAGYGDKNGANTNNEGALVRDDFAERDLAHIRNVLSYLEHSAESVRAVEKGMVVNLGYWRGRVRAILAIPLLSMHVEKQAKDLLGRLDRLERSGS